MAPDSADDAGPGPPILGAVTLSLSVSAPPPWLEWHRADSDPLAPLAALPPPWVYVRAKGARPRAAITGELSDGLPPPGDHLALAALAAALNASRATELELSITADWAQPRAEATAAFLDSLTLPSLRVLGVETTVHPAEVAALVALLARAPRLERLAIDLSRSQRKHAHESAIIAALEAVGRATDFCLYGCCSSFWSGCRCTFPNRLSPGHLERLTRLVDGAAERAAARRAAALRVLVAARVLLRAYPEGGVPRARRRRGGASVAAAPAAPLLALPPELRLHVAALAAGGELTEEELQTVLGAAGSADALAREAEWRRLAGARGIGEAAARDEWLASAGL
ncbi:hypothetical protein Q8F55_000099 [Vanrija albida]|uniref:Uncharacterized protein n=1 Tax=Vanrija albida TaxID=181172 RepID=A0ABR3QCI2_9TREE